MKLPLSRLLFAILACSVTTLHAESLKPNILWLVAEDSNVEWFGCYGNTRAKTPNIDKLATEGFRYTAAYASAPVCAASRTTLITGINGVSMGTHPMRSRYEIPHNLIKYYPDYLREGGYYTINQSKTDYNIGGRPDNQCWDATGNVDGWTRAKAGQPWFEVINFFESHESKAQGPVTSTRHSTEDVALAKYHPNIPEIRANYAMYYDAVENMDTSVGQALAKLKASGQEENTIVIFCSDHGGVMPRSKRFLFDSGTHAPLIIRIPEKFKSIWPAASPGTTVDRLVSFLDFPKTWLSITGSPIPSVMQGRIFLGSHTEPEPTHVFSFRGRMDERYDNQRSVRDKRFVYIKNYMPFVAWGQHLDYMWKLTATQAWEKAHKEGKTDPITDQFFNSKPVEELYDTKVDSDNVVNLADNPEYKDVLKALRGKLRDWQTTIHDAGILPEAEIDRRADENKTTIYQMARDQKIYNLPAYLDAADLALVRDAANKPKLQDYLKSEDSGIRYWGVVGYLMLEKEELTATDLTSVKPLLDDPCGEARAIASWVLIRSGEAKAGEDCLNEMIKHPSPTRLFALNVLDWMHLANLDPYKKNLLEMKSAKPAGGGKKSGNPKSNIDTGNYEGDMHRYLLESLGVKEIPSSETKE